MTKEADIPLIELITGAFHAVNCAEPDKCKNDCGGRMTTQQAVAVYEAVHQRMDRVFQDMGLKAL